MSEKKIFKAKDPSGNDAEYEMLDTFYNKRTNKNYVIYTDGTFNDEGKLKIYASIYTPCEYEFRLSPIIDEDEWRLVERYIDGELS